MFALRSRRTVANLVAGRDHLCSLDGVRSLISRFCPVADLAELPVELHVVTTNLDTGRPAWWTAGAPGDVLAASAALPGIFPPVDIDGNRHVDGGVLMPVPAVRAFDLGIGRIYVSDIATRTRPNLPERLGPLGVLLEAFNVARYSLAPDPVPPPGVEVTVLPSPGLDGRSMFDFSRTQDLVDQAYHATCQALGRLEVAAAG